MVIRHYKPHPCSGRNNHRQELTVRIGPLRWRVITAFRYSSQASTDAFGRSRPRLYTRREIERVSVSTSNCCGHFLDCGCARRITLSATRKVLVQPSHPQLAVSLLATARQKQPVSFEPNLGQAASDVLLAHIRTTNLWACPLVR
jgi:hypothetical protein